MNKALRNTIRGIVLSSAVALATTAIARDDDSTNSTHQQLPTSASTTATTTTDTTITTAGASTTDKAAAAFMKDASKDNALEIALARHAKDQSQNSEVKAFAEHMLKDHMAAKEKMTALAQTHSVALAQDAAAVTKKLEKYTNMSGDEFDKAFATVALKMHQMDLAKYEKASKAVSAPDVKAFIDNNLPKLREHQQHAAKVAQALGIEQSTITALTKSQSSDNDAVGGTRESGIEDSAFDSSDDAGRKNQKGHGAHKLTEKEEGNTK